MILPQTYFDGLSSLWGACAYVGSVIVASGLVLHSVRARPGGMDFIWLLAQVFIIGIATLFIREWLMRLNDIVITFGQEMMDTPVNTGGGLGTDAQHTWDTAHRVLTLQGVSDTWPGGTNSLTLYVQTATGAPLSIELTYTVDNSPPSGFFLPE